MTAECEMIMCILRVTNKHKSTANRCYLLAQGCSSGKERCVYTSVKMGAQCAVNEKGSTSQDCQAGLA